MVYVMCGVLFFLCGDQVWEFLVGKFDTVFDVVLAIRASCGGGVVVYNRFVIALIFLRNRGG